jgi:hypothetical protein
MKHLLHGVAIAAALAISAPAWAQPAMTSPATPPPTTAAPPKPMAPAAAPVQAAKPQMHKKAIGYRYVCCFPRRVWHPPVHYCCAWHPRGHWVYKKIVVNYCCVKRVIVKKVWVPARVGCCGWRPHYWGWGWHHGWWGSIANELNHEELLRLRAGWRGPGPVMPPVGPAPVGYAPPPPPPGPPAPPVGYPPAPPEGPRPSGGTGIGPK